MKKACTVLNFFLDPTAYYHKTRHHPLEMTDSYVLDIILVYKLRVVLTDLYRVDRSLVRCPTAVNTYILQQPPK